MGNKKLNTCRICLEHGATIPIFETNENNSVRAKLSTCTNEKIEDVEGFPQNICFSCDDTLDIVYNFIKKYRESTNLLMCGLTKIKKEINDENEVSTDSPSLCDFKIESDDDDDKTLSKFVKPLNNSKKVNAKDCNNETQEKLNETKGVTSSVPQRSGRKIQKQSNAAAKIKKTCKQKIIPKKTKEEAKSKEIVQKEKVKECLCDFCGSLFPSSEKLAKHKKVTHLKNPVKCPKCPKTLINDYYLNRHMIRKHKSGPKEFPCPTCGKDFAFRGELRTHIKTVHNKHLKPKRTYTCKFCKKTYLCPKSVIVHERSVHTGLRPAECSICGASFYHRDYLKEHMRLHTGETPFKCPICSRGYAQLSNMKSHLRVHRMSELDEVTLSKLRPNYIKLLKDNRKRSS